ncbi:hypothetical protein L596_022805 [Steinernema carpocapsae]|uniref:Uncharacterized protein n=1 Tax=Steinernema carpocapsae TaxID=34508 RepID=A0A4U5MMW4_STECR|nr:hypothetical protein L596_022805 [Steinernema carpocapsae]
MLAADALYLKFPLHTTKNADPSFEDYYDRETIRDVYPVRAHTRPDQFIFGEKTIWTSRCEYMEIEHHKKGASIFFINYNSVPFNNAYKFSHLRSQASLQNGAEYILPKIKAQGSHSLKDLLFYRDFELLFTQNELRQISYGGDLYLNDINQKVAFEFTNGTSRANSDKIQEYFEMHKKRSESDPLKLPLDMGSRFVYGVLIDGVPVIVGQEV